jgi:hypothetical protein
VLVKVVGETPKNATAFVPLMMYASVIVQDPIATISPFDEMFAVPLLDP